VITLSSFSKKEKAKEEEEIDACDNANKKK